MVIDRLVIFDTPCLDELLARLRALQPDCSYVPRGRWHYTPRIGQGADQTTVPVWYWREHLGAFRQQAASLLRDFVYPLVASGQPFCVAFPFGSEALSPAALHPGGISDLDREDIGHLLRRDALTTTFATLEHLRTRVPFTPIEEQLDRAMKVLGIVPRPQIKLGQYRADFLVERDGRQVVVEADGRDFHSPEHDEPRDQALRAHGIEAILHFTGSRIYHDATGCAEEVRRHLDGHVVSVCRGVEPDLDASQRTAAEHGVGAARVLAPAGSGKTKVLLNRIVTLLDQGVPSERILALAFNRKAAAQLEERLGMLGIAVCREILPEPHAGVVCATFHAFGERYGREVLKRRLQIAKGDVLRDLMHRAMKDAGVDLSGLKPARGSDPVGAFMKALDLVKADLQSPDDVEVEIESYDSGGNKRVPFGPAFRAYEQRRLAARLQSYDDQIYAAVCDLLAEPGHRDKLQGQYDHVLVDEFQDLNAAQLALVETLSRPHRNLFIVGDDDQLIYGWRFAKPASLLAFHDRMPPRPLSATYTLSTNYRCARAIVDASSRLIAHNQVRERKAIAAMPGAPAGAVRFFGAVTWGERAGEICRFLVAQHERAGSPWRRLAVLCRYKAQQMLVAQALDAAQIPRTLLLRYQLFTHRDARLLRAYLSLVLAPAELDETDIRSILKRPNRYLANETVDELASHPRGWNGVERWAAEPWTSSPYALENVRGLVERVSAFRSRVASGSISAPQLVDDVVREFELEREWTDEARPKTGRNQDEAGALELLRVIRALATDWLALGDFLREWDSRHDAEVAQLGMAEDDLSREEPAEDDRVVIGTIHSAKGREYDAVVIPDYDPSIGRSLGKPPEVEEERRVLYVGVTRAKRAILLTVDRSQPWVHPFVRELVQPRSDAGELDRARERLAQLRAREEELAGVVAEAKEETSALKSGAALHECAAAIFQQQARLQALDLKIAALRRTHAARPSWWRLHGDDSEAHLQCLGQDRTAVQAALERLEARRLAIQRDPKRLLQEAMARGYTARLELDANTREQMHLAARVGELELLA